MAFLSSTEKLVNFFHFDFPDLPFIAFFFSENNIEHCDLLKVEPPSGKRVKARFSPMGVITGIPLSGDRKSMVLRHELAGDITINNDAVVMFEFNDIKELFTDWDANF